MREPVLGVAALLTVLACAPAARRGAVEPAPTTQTTVDTSTAAGRVTALADDLMGGLLERAPEMGTFYGLPNARHDRLMDNSVEALRVWERREDAWLQRLRSIDRSALIGPELITYGILDETLASAAAARVCRTELWPVSQMTGWQTGFAYLGQLQPVGTDELRSQAITRWHAMPRYIDTEMANLRLGVREGYTVSRGNVERVIAQLDGLLEGPPTGSPLFGPALRDSTPEFQREIERAVANNINPAIRRYRDYLRDEYMPVARTSIAISDLPQGEACYRALARGFTTLDLSPREIHETGLRQMEIIQAEMSRIAERSFGTSDVPALLQRFRTDTQFTFSSRQEIIDYAQAAVDRGKAAMGQWFGILPKADVIIEPYPAFQEASSPGGEYLNPADDGSRPGIYRINTYQPGQQSKVGVESTAFHEAIPGHHLQIAIQQERGGAHPVTRFLFNSAYAEGWALYSERLADDMGLFSSDLARMGLLSNEALRAARLVVDPGMHVLGWTREQAIEYMLRHTAESPDMVATEVDRYIVWPGQATAYMIGSLEIFRLRDWARQQLGDRFDIREFHDRVLEDGSVTLPMLRTKIERWVEEKRGS